MILPNGALVAVLDGQTMRIFRNIGHDPRIQLTELPAPELGKASAGSGTRHRSSLANPDHRRIEEDDFAAAAAGYLNRKALEGGFGNILIIADPRTLGELRRHFHPALAARLVGEIASDLAGHSGDAVREAIGRA